MNIVLIGFKSSGKSTVGKELAKLLGTPFVDTDGLLEAHYRKKHGSSLSTREIYEHLGPEGMRALEAEVVLDLGTTHDSVIATGGGVVMQPQHVLEALRKAGLCVFLDTALPVLEERLSKVTSPLFAEKTVAELHKERYQRYMEAAHVHIPFSDVLPPEQIAQLLLTTLGREGEYQKEITGLFSLDSVVK